MTPEQFVYWLQGFMEMADPTILTEKQIQQIKDHLALVFNKQTPDLTDFPNPHNPPSPMTGQPIFPNWEVDPNIFRPICETNSTTITGIPPINLEVDDNTKRLCGGIEDAHNKLFCDTLRVPPHMFGEGKTSKGKKVKGGLKC